MAISTLLRAGFSRLAIAEQLGVHRSTVYREIDRNGSKNVGYLPIVAERRVKERKARYLKLKEDNALSQTVANHLKEGWSPEQIAGRLKRENGGCSVISHETIYRWIYSDFGKRNRYYACLRKKRRWRAPIASRKMRCVIPERVSIAERPAAVNQRQEFGHWEGDLMLFSRDVTRLNLITLRERVSRYFVAILNPSRHAKGTAERIITYFTNGRAQGISSMTFDNGSEFFGHLELVRELAINTYFCDPYKSWQKGSVENGNGVLRVELPRSTVLDSLSQRELDKIVMNINRRPMKCLGYETPEEVFNRNMSHLKQSFVSDISGQNL